MLASNLTIAYLKMINAYQDPIAYDYKLCFDGFDFLNSQLGQAIANPFLDKWIRTHHDQHDLRFAEDFVQMCMKYRRLHEPIHGLPIHLRDKYEMGLFVTSRDNCFDHPYIMFNREELDFWESDSMQAYGQVFIVAPSRDATGAINEIGFRILDTRTVQDAFKWTFMCGQQATYGLHEADLGAKLTLVEGAWDRIAFAESGVRNTVGLGAVSVMDGHKKFLDRRKYDVCWDADTFGLSQRQENGSYSFYTPDGKDPFDAWIKHGRIQLLNVL